METVDWSREVGRAGWHHHCRPARILRLSCHASINHVYYSQSSIPGSSRLPAVADGACGASVDTMYTGSRREHEHGHG